MKNDKKNPEIQKFRIFLYYFIFQRYLLCNQNSMQLHKRLFFYLYMKYHTLFHLHM